MTVGREAKEEPVLTVFRVAYSLAVAILFVLVVVVGVRSFYEGPDDPGYPAPRFAKVGPTAVEPIYCDPDGSCFKGGALLTAVDEAQLTAEERQILQEARDFNRLRADYEDERAAYHRNVFILASILGAAAIAAGVALFRRVDALPLGLVLGGIGVVIFGWAQAAEDFGEIGMAPLFVVALVALLVVMASGYWFLGTPRGGSAGMEK